MIKSNSAHNTPKQNSNNPALPRPLYSGNSTVPSTRQAVTRLQGRVGVGEKHLKVLLEPLSGLGRVAHGAVVRAAEVVEAGGGRVGDAIALAAGLDPDEGVRELRPGVGRRAPAEADALLVAPVAPLLLAGGLLSGAA